MKILIDNYTFDASAKTITFGDYASITLDQVLMITNVTDHVVIYQFNSPTKKGTVSTNVLTLEYDTTSMDDTDRLQIFYDDFLARERVSVEASEGLVLTTATITDGFASPIALGDADNSNEAIFWTGKAVGSAKAAQVAIVDGAGNQITSFGGGTEYTEDAVAAADPIGKMAMAVAQTTPNGNGVASGDNIALRANLNGELYTTQSDRTASGSLSALNATVSIGVAGCSVAAFQLTGSWGGGVVAFEGTVDGSTWVSTEAWLSTTGVAGSGTGSNDVAIVPCAGFLTVRARMSVYTSGTATVTVIASPYNDVIRTIGTNRVVSVPSDPFGTNADASVAAGASGSISAKLRRATQGLEDLKSLIVLAAGNNNIGDVDVATVPADPFGANADAIVAAGAVGSIQAKLRRVTQGLEDLKTGIILATGSNAIGKLAANSGVNIGDVNMAPISTGGWDVKSCSSGDGLTALTNSSQTVKGSAGKLGGWYIYNPNSAISYVIVYDATSPTVGTTTPKMVICVPANGGTNVEFTNGIAFANAITVAATTTGGGSVAPTTALEANFMYK